MGNVGFRAREAVIDMKTVAALATLFALVLPGCGKPASNLDVKGLGGRIMYPITADEADAVLYRALRSTAPEADVTAVAEPNKGYVAVINKDRRSYTYTASAVPAIGLKPDGTRVDGYAFEVSGWQSVRASYLLESINLGAATISAPLPLASTR